MPFFPFLLAASAVLAITAASRSGWRTSAQIAEGVQPVHGLVGAGYAPKRWTFWYVQKIGATQLIGVGPYLMTDMEAMQTIVRTRVQDPRVQQIYRFLYDPSQGTWFYDYRTEGELAMGSLPKRTAVGGGIRDQSEHPLFQAYERHSQVGGLLTESPYTRQLQKHVQVGAHKLPLPIRGRWTYRGFPEVVTFAGVPYRRTRRVWNRPGVIAQYREARADCSKHLMVFENGTYLIDHIDEVNPDMGSVIDHFVKDVVKRPAGYGFS